MINLHCIASGSKGNASLIFDDKTLILVDLGIEVNVRGENLGMQEFADIANKISI